MPNAASKFHVWLLFFSWTYSRRSTYCFYKRHEYINVWLYIQVPNIIVGNICWYQEISYYLLHRTIYIISLLYFKYTCDADDVKLAAIELSSFQKTLKIEKKKILLKFPERWFEYSFAVGEKWTCVNLPQAVTHDIVERVSDKNTCQKKNQVFWPTSAKKKLLNHVFPQNFKHLMSRKNYFPWNHFHEKNSWKWFHGNFFNTYSKVCWVIGSPKEPSTFRKYIKSCINLCIWPCKSFVSWPLGKPCNLSSKDHVATSRRESNKS